MSVKVYPHTDFYERRKLNYLLIGENTDTGKTTYLARFKMPEDAVWAAKNMFRSNRDRAIHMVDIGKEEQLFRWSSIDRNLSKMQIRTIVDTL